MVFDILISSVNWSALRTDSGTGGDLPAAIRDLVGSSSAEEASSAYWRIDNEAVVQGALYQAAEPTLTVLLSVVPVIPPGVVRRSVAELIQQIVYGAAHDEEIFQGNAELAERCKGLARGALWDFYHWLDDDDPEVRELALLILHAIESDAARKDLVFDAFRSKESSTRVLKVFAQIQRNQL